GAGAGDLSVLDRVVVAAHAAQPGAHEFFGHVFALGRELVAEEDHGNLLVWIELVGVHEAHAVSGVDGDRCLRLDQQGAVERLVLQRRDLLRERQITGAMSSNLMPAYFAASLSNDSDVTPCAAKPMRMPLRSLRPLNLPLSIRSLRMNTV